MSIPVKNKTILLLFNVPLGSNKSKNWVDGFTSAMDILKTKYKIIYQNVQEKEISTNAKDYLNIDLILVKANWGALLEQLSYKNLKSIPVKKGLLISGSKPPTSNENLFFYDILFYETHWYKSYIKDHPLSFHAFGINSDLMKNDNKSKREIDYLSVGSFKLYKRLHYILKFKGSKVIIGEIPKKLSLRSLQDYVIYYFLKLAGVKIIDFMDYHKLSEYYNNAKFVYIPAKINGGGERAVLEARSCGAEVLIEKDNSKLQSLLDSKVYNHYYYADQLENGIEKVI